MNILRYISSNNINTSNIKEWFSTFGFKVKMITPNIFIIKYQIDCKEWSIWGKQCRGIVLQYSNNSWQILKYALNRGSELLTKYHIENGISKLPGNDPTKNELESILQSNELIYMENTFITEKIDGSLFCVSIHFSNGKRCNTNNNYNIFQTNINEKCTKYNFSCIFSTQGTYFIDCINTQNYIMTSLNHDLDGFLDKINQLSKFLQNDSTISFEAVCKNRTSTFANNATHNDQVIHEEFAISYNENFIKLLAITDLDTMTITPHFAILFPIPFEQPLFSIITSNHEINEIMQRCNNEGFVIYYHNIYNKIKTIDYYCAHCERKDLESSRRMYLLGKNNIKFPNAVKFYKSFKEFKTLVKKIHLDTEQLSKNQKIQIILNKNHLLSFEIITKIMPHFKYLTNEKNINRICKLFLLNLMTKNSYENLYNFYLLHKKALRLSTCPEILGAYIFGCPYSTDTDILIILKNPKDIDNYVHQRVDKNTIYTLMDNYIDPNKELDICFATLENNNTLINNNGLTRLSKTSKGGKETQNIVIKTYNLHKQKYPLVLNGIIIDIKEEKLMAWKKFIIDNFEKLVDNNTYNNFHQTKNEAYANANLRTEFVKLICPLIRLPNDSKLTNILKSLTMKCIQLIIYPELIYEKKVLAQQIKNIKPEYYEIVHDLLFRHVSNYESVTSVIIWLISSVLENLPVDNIFIPLKLDLNINHTTFSDTLYQEFIKNPIEPTEAFINEYGKTTLKTIVPHFSEISINKMFISPNLNVELLPLKIIQNNVIDVQQKSYEWLKLNKVYTCGLNTGINEYNGPIESFEWVSFYYNLIRGALGEQIVSNINDLELLKLFPGAISIKKIFIGLIVDKVSNIGASPDMILYVTYPSSHIFVPVEIKCCIKDIRRSINLATKQLKLVANILGPLHMQIGLLLLMSFEPIIISGSIISLC